MIKYLILNFLLCSLMTSQTTITIYNQRCTLVQEQRKKKFSYTGKQNLLISKIQHATQSSSINIYSDDVQIISKENIYRPIYVESILNLPLTIFTNV